MQATHMVKQRNYGIDLLRLLAAFYVIVLHTIYQAGIYYNVSPGSAQEKTCQFLLSFSYCAVNLFGIISGYAGYSDSEKSYNLPGYILLWLQVVSYGIVISLLGRFLFPGLSGNSRLLHSLFPVTNNTYWYFTAYTLLFFFTPLLNNAVRNTRKETLILFLCFTLLVFSPFEVLYGHFYSVNGYTFLWLMMLYLTGSILKKLQFGHRIPSVFLFCGIAVLTALTYVLHANLPQIERHFSRFTQNTLMSYTFPLYLYNAVLYTILFTRAKFGKWMKRIISFAAPGAFSVYIVNVHPFVWAWLEDRFSSWAVCSAPDLLIHVLVFSILFVSAVAVTDCIRRKIFSVLRIRQILQKLFASVMFS